MPADDSEDEIEAIVVLRPGATLEASELLDFLTPRLPYFMIPRYVRFVADPLPKTPTGKIQKSLLREAGVSGCWDRVAVGYRVVR